VGGPGGLAALLQRSHGGTTISVRFRRSRRSTPSDYSDGRWLISLRCTRVETRGAAPQVGRLAPPKRPGLPVPPERQPARGRVARERARCVRQLNLASRSQVSAEADGAHRSGRRIDRGQRTDRSDEPSAKRACETVAEAKLTASSRSLSPEHPRVPGQRKTLGNRHIQLSLPFG